MKKALWLFMIFATAFMVTCTAYAEWKTPTVITVSQEGGQTSKIGKYGNNVYVLNTDSGYTLKFYKSTDGGSTFSSGVTLGSNVMNGTELEMKVDSNGYIHVFWENSTDDILYYRRSTDNGNTFSSSVALTSGMDWADEPHCFVENTNIIYLIFRAYSTPRSEVYFIKSTNGGTSFGSPIRITNNSIQEDNPKICIFNGVIYVTYLDYYSSQNLYLIKSNNGGSSFSSPVRVNKTDKKTDFGFDIAVDRNGYIFIPYKDTVNDYEGDLYVARSKDSGNSFDYTMAADSTSRYQEYPRITVFNDIIYLGWYDYRQENGEVYLTRSTNGGESYETNFNVSSSSQNQSVRDLVVDNDGVYLLVTDYGYSPYATKLYMTAPIVTPTPTPTPSPTPAQPPKVTTGSATNVTTSSATLNGTVNAHGLTTTAGFEYGTSIGTYSNTSSTQTVNGTTDTSVSINISGLSGGTTYYYRVAARNSAGTTYGSEMTFITVTPTPTPTPTISPCTDSYEPNDSFNTAYGPLISGSSYSGKICSPSDVDYFKITVDNPVTISLTLNVPSNKDYDLDLYNSSQSLIANSTAAAGITETITYSASTTGTYYIQVIGYSGAYDVSQTYTLSGTWTARPTPTATPTPVFSPTSQPTPSPLPTPTFTLPPRPTPPPSPITEGIIFGIVNDPDDLPIKGVTVTITGNRYSDSTNTDENGFYTFRGLAAGNYKLTYEKEGYITKTQNITLKEGETLDLGIITMEISKSNIFGSVVNVKGNPIESVRLKLTGVRTSISQTISSDVDGFFKFLDLDADTYVIFAKKKAYKRSKQTVKLGEHEDKEIEIVMKKIRKKSVMPLGH